MSVELRLVTDGQMEGRTDNRTQGPGTVYTALA